MSCGYKFTISKKIVQEAVSPVKVEYSSIERRTHPLAYRFGYAFLWLLTIIMYSIPWASLDGEVYTGWSFTVPFSFTYLIGILLGLIVLVIKFKPVTMTVIAGIMMVLGVLGATFGYAIGGIFAGLFVRQLEIEAGLPLAFILSIIYMIVGAYICKRIREKSQLINKVAHKESKGGRGKWIAALIIIFFIGAFLGYLAGYAPATIQTVTMTITIEKTIAGTALTSPAATEGGLVMRIGEPVRLRGWELLVDYVKIADYIVEIDHFADYYKPKEGMKFVVVNIKAKNVGEDAKKDDVFIDFILVTDKANSYDEIDTWDLEDMWSYEITAEVKEKALEYKDFPSYELIPPNVYSKGTILFQIPVDEKPVALYFRVGELYPTFVIVPLK